jgi:hypothetical protein
MSVEFNDENQDRRTNGTILYSRIQRSNQPPAMVRWLINHGVGSEKAANVILLVAVVFCFAASVVVYRTFTTTTSTQSPSTVSGQAHPHIPDVQH